MEFPISSITDHLIILGAGASKDYGLPLWMDLCPKMKEVLESEEGEAYTYKDEIISWIDKVGDGNKYATIDECIALESVSKEYRGNGGDIENQIFILMGDILNNSYNESEDAWIGKFNKKILDSRTNLEDQIAFINYNYDNVLDRNLLNFENLSQKEKRSTYRRRISELSNKRIPVLFPHGSLFTDNGGYESHLYRQVETPKTGDEEYVDAVTCFDSNRHIVYKQNKLQDVKLYILGLGGGLKHNLSKISLGNQVSEIHVTIRDESLTSEVLEFLSSRYRVAQNNIGVYSTCEELVLNCF